MSQSYKACLHAAIEDPQWRGNFSGVHAACAGAHHGNHCSGSVQPNGQFSFDCTQQVGPVPPIPVVPPSAAPPSGVKPIPPFIPVFPPAPVAPAPAARPIPPFVPVFPPAPVAPAPAVGPIPPFVPVFPPAVAPVRPPAPGHGCITGAGYTWCPTTQKCQRPWEEPCPGLPSPPPSAPISPPGVAPIPVPNTPLGPGGQRNYMGYGLPYVPSHPGALKNELSSPFQSSGGVLWRDDPNLFNQFDPFGTAMPLNTYTNDRGGRFSQFYTNGMF